MVGSGFGTSCHRVLVGHGRGRRGRLSRGSGRDGLGLGCLGWPWTTRISERVRGSDRVLDGVINGPMKGETGWGGVVQKGVLGGVMRVCEREHVLIKSHMS